MTSTTIDEDRSLHYIIDLPVERITIGDRKRSPNTAHVAALAESIKSQGLLAPVVVREADTASGPHVLVSGYHRLLAVKSLGHGYIASHVIGADDVKAELAEIDENLIRSELTELERSEHLARRKQLYEELYPETRSVTERGGPGRGKTSDNLSPVSAPSFAAEISAARRREREAVA